MSRVFHLSDDTYNALVDVAAERGLTPEALFQQWVEQVRRQVASHDRDPEQAWFWSDEWLAGEHRADKDKAAGRFVRYESDDDFLASLEDDNDTNGPPDADLR